MNEIVASQNKILQWVRILQIIVTIFIILLSVITLVILVAKDVEYNDRTDKMQRAYRAEVLLEWSKDMSWVFLILAFLLCISVVILLVVLKRRIKGHSTNDSVHMTKEFGGEICRLFTMLFFFMLSYVIRFFGDYILVPDLISPQNAKSCTVNNLETLCLSYRFI